MSWRDLRTKARAVVHATFQQPAQHFRTKVTTGAGNSITVRDHSNTVVTGDLDREQYTKVVEDVDRLILLTSDVEQYKIEEGHYVKLSDGRVMFLELQRPTNDMFTVTFEVKRQ